MRVLLSNNGTIHCIEAYTVLVCPENDELTLENSETFVTVSGICQRHAEAAVRTLFREGMVDLSMYRSDV
jgi:hypothetical protein